MKTTFLLILTIALTLLLNPSAGGHSPAQTTAQERVCQQDTLSPIVAGGLPPGQITAQERVCQYLRGEKQVSVIEVYRMFQGREPKRTLTLRVPEGARLPLQVAQLGKLREIIGMAGKFEMQFPWGTRDGALLLSTAKGTMYAYDPFGSLQSIPRVLSVVYETDKGQGEGLYEHSFLGTTELIIVPGSRGKFARFSGAYRIDERGIVS